MSNLREAAQQALEALEERYVGALRDKAMDALRAALDQPEQEPVAWLELRTLSSGGYASPIKEWHVTQNPSTSNAPRKPLYINPPQRKPLTDEEIWSNDEVMECNAHIGAQMNELMRLVRAIEKALKEKNHY